MMFYLGHVEELTFQVCGIVFMATTVLANHLVIVLGSVFDFFWLPLEKRLDEIHTLKSGQLIGGNGVGSGTLTV